MRTLPILVAVLALALAGCGGSSNKNAGSNTSGAPTPASTPAGGGGSASGALQLAAPADGNLKFDKTSLSAKAGKVTIELDNPASVPHAIAIEGNGVDQKSDQVTQSKTSVTADLKPGTYTFYCPVPGHEQAGMKGTLTVK